MNYNDRYLIILLNAALYDKIPQLPETNINWEYINDKSKEQNITALVYSSINKIKDKVNIDKELCKKFENQTILTSAYSVRQFSEFEKIHNIFVDNGLTFIGLKGCVLRNLYPMPELRTMGDFDILVKKEELSEIKDKFIKSGYEIKKDYVGITCVKNSITWEIFTSLEQEFKENTKYWDQKFLNNTIQITGINCPILTLFFLHLILHTGKHCMSEGTGIRNLCDIALFLNRYRQEIDFVVVEKACKEQGYYKIYCYLINAAAKWLDADISNINIPETDTEKFVEYMLLNGVFGKHGNTVLSQLTKAENKNDSIGKKLFFPSVDALKHRYKYLNNHPYLLPIAWLHRFFLAVFKRKFSVSRMSKDIRSAIEYSETREKWLKELNLMD